MNRFVMCFAAVVMLSWAGPALAENANLLADVEPAGPRNTITVNPLGLALGTFNVEYERAVSSSMSWFIGPQYFSYSSDSVLEDESVSSVGLSGGVRLFVSGTAPEGWFLSPNLSLAYAVAEGGDVEGTAVGYSVGFIGGYTWLIADVVDISLGLGAQYISAEVEVEGEEIGFAGVLPSGRLAVGVAF